MSEKPKISRPVPKNFPISSPYGPRTIGGKEEFHKGIDFAVPVGTPIIAASDGIIFKAGWENPKNQKQGFGFRIWQVSNIGGTTYDIFYGHCNEIFVKDGDKVKKGHLLAHSGNTGRTTGAHLHIGVRKTGSGEFCDFEIQDS